MHRPLALPDARGRLAAAIEFAFIFCVCALRPYSIHIVRTCSPEVAWGHDVRGGPGREEEGGGEGGVGAQSATTSSTQREPSCGRQAG